MISINADDFGASREVNEGVLKAFKEGIINSASIINIDEEEKENAIKLAKAYKIPCGIHLYKKGAPYLLFLKALLSKKFLSNLEKDFENQILELKRDIEINHINTHHHIHMFPPIFNITTRLAKKYNLRLRLCKKIDISLINRLGLRLFYNGDRRKAIRENISFIDGYQTPSKRLNILMRKIKEGEIIIHPKIMPR